MIENVRRLGVERPLRPFASTLLGAVELSPLEVAQMYQTIASGGFRSPLRAIREVTTQEGRPLTRYPLAVEQVFAPEPIYLLSAAMQEVVRAGTGQGLNKFLPPEIAPAGKTGTTDEQRDAWFAGFTGDRLAVVWVGYDDNRAARLGSAAALPIWGDMMAALAPEPLPSPSRNASSSSRSIRRPSCAAESLAPARAKSPSCRARRHAIARPVPAPWTPPSSRWDKPWSARRAGSIAYCVANRFCTIRGLMGRFIALALLLSGCAVPPTQPGPEPKPEAPPAIRSAATRSAGDGRRSGPHRNRTQRAGGGKHGRCRRIS